jgi:hypothetical protein
VPIAEAWQPLYATCDLNGFGSNELSPGIGFLKKDLKRGYMLVLEWMQCPNQNPKCEGIIVRATKYEYDPGYREPGKSVQFTQAPHENEQVWIAVPQRRAVRPIDPLLPDAFADPFREAWLIRDDSPGMSAVLSRRVLADLLEQYAGCTGYTVKEQIDKFIADAQHPSHVKENLHYLREMADFAAHTKKDLTTGEILKTTSEEATWTLDVVESLFHYFIIGPAKDAARRAEMAKKMQQAGRKPIPPLQAGKP